VAATDTKFEHLLDTLKRAGAVLRDAEIPFALGGGVAIWAYGGPETEHDLDFFVKPEDAERALQALAENGFRPEKPPEGWLYKAWDGDVLVDLIFYPKGLPIDDAVLARGETMSVLAMDMQVMAIEDVLITKLMALNEHALRYEGLLEIARALREQVDWPHVRAATAESPFARAFFVLLEGLAIVPEQPGGARVRVITSARSEAEGRG
jgi:hypothetical protein